MITVLLDHLVAGIKPSAADKGLFREGELGTDI